MSGMLSVLHLSSACAASQDILWIGSIIDPSTTAVLPHLLCMVQEVAMGTCDVDAMMHVTLQQAYVNSILGQYNAQ